VISKKFLILTALLDKSLFTCGIFSFSLGIDISKRNYSTLYITGIMFICFRIFVIVQLSTLIKLVRKWKKCVKLGVLKKRILKSRER